MTSCAGAFALVMLSAAVAGAQPPTQPTAQPAAQPTAQYDFLIKGGRIAAVASDIPASSALKSIDASGLHVTPGLIDIHVHVYPWDRTRGH